MWSECEQWMSGCYGTGEARDDLLVSFPQGRSDQWRIWTGAGWNRGTCRVVCMYM